MIYLLEDDDSIRKLVIYALNSQGYEAKGFERPAEFWKAMGQAQPDLVLASSNTAAQLDLLPALEQLGLNVAYFKVAEFQDYLHMLDLCTQLTGDTDRFAQYGLGVERQVQAARDRADGSAPTVLYIRATGAGCKVKNSRDSVLGEMLRDLGCVNIADSDETLLEQLSLERILQLDPDFIFVVMQGADKRFDRILKCTGRR